MKYLTLLLPLFVCMYLFSTSVYSGETTDTVSLQAISYNIGTDNKESVVFELGNMIEPKIFQLKGDNPRIVIDFPNGSYKGKNVIPVENATFAYAIRVGIHTEPTMKTRVVIDLTKENKVRYETSFSEDGKTLTVALSAAAREKIGPGPAVVKKKVVKKQRAVPPVFAGKDSVTAKEIGQDMEESKARLLEISFDDSSNKGEMVIFRLNDFYPPSVSAIEKETPRVLCDFVDMELGPDVNKAIFANGKYVERIMTDYQNGKDKIRVVLDLAQDRDYDLQQVFFKNDNLFVLIVNELPPEVVENGEKDKETAAKE
jgi:hypothetical protein